MVEMVEHTQKICRSLPTNCLGVFDNFAGLVLKGSKSTDGFRTLSDFNDGAFCENMLRLSEKKESS